LSHLPDHGEELALINLNNLCKRIGEIYEPGARIVICSDGRVFADVVRIPDQDVSEYNSTLRQGAVDQGLAHLDFFDLDDVYPGVKDYAVLREDLMVLYGEALRPLQERCKAHSEAAEMYRGITRFLFEDFSGLDEFRGMSRNAIQVMARSNAYRVIQRSNAWGRLLADQLQDAVRLSIQVRLSEKIGINLIDSGDCWATPWHSVVLKRGNKVQLVPRREAEKMNAALIFKDGRPSYYQLQEAA
jgi:pyoverdine/dityrosine biosynthesis protein Dit1